jgi:hypothetical protein
MIKSVISTVFLSIESNPISSSLDQKLPLTNIVAVGGISERLLMCLFVLLMLPAMLLVSFIMLLLPCCFRIPVCGTTLPSPKTYSRN